MATPKLNYTAKELSKMDRQDLIDKFIEQQSFAISSLQKFAEVNENIANLATEMAIIKKSIPAASSSSSNISERMEREHYQMQQYSRRDCIELVGVPTSVEDKNLEKKSLEILKSINVEVQPSEVQACHRMFDKKRVIIKFLNRKTAIECLKNRSKLKTVDKKKFGFQKGDIYLNESLCPYYRYLFGKCLALKKDGKIDSVWSYNGTVRVRLTDESVKSISLETDISKLNL